MTGLEILLTCEIVGWLIGCVLSYYEAKSTYTPRRQLLGFCLFAVALWPIFVYISFRDWQWLDAYVGTKKPKKEQGITGTCSECGANGRVFKHYDVLVCHTCHRKLHA